ncbi:hypothetical protein MNBD_GAMMA06-1970 [hydrothermal vent metagenome]|uniref:Lipoprotein n=1 Tax=hydrothermal vent metagenome TaxID=652676 RepID=A0A3B0WKR7_9ZZZZ
MLVKRMTTNLRLNACLKLFYILSLGVLLQSCASYSSRAMTMRDGLLTGHPEKSLAVAEKEDIDQKEIIASLDKGMLRRINQDYTRSNQIFEVAKQEIKKLYGFSITENLASVTINETLRGYEGDRYEQLLLHAYMAMNYIQLGQVDGARVEMLQANVKMMEWGDEPEEDAFLRYLEGLIYESLGEDDSALISYRKAYIVYKEKGGEQYPVTPKLIKKDLLRLLALEGLNSEYELYKKEFNMANYKPGKRNKNFGELVVILNNGLAPIRNETAVQIFSTEVEHNLRVAFPVYNQSKQRLHASRISVGKKQLTLETVEDIDALARYSLEQAMPGIMARATARAVVKYNTQKTASDKSGIAGLLMTVTNIVTERADTRSWSTLPQEIQLQRVVLPVGEYPLRIELMNAAGRVIDVIEEMVVIKPEQISFVIKHWNTPIPKINPVKSTNAINFKTVNSSTILVDNTSRQY